MKFNFYISCENSEEAQQCIKFIDKITSGRKTWEDHLDANPLAKVSNIPAIKPKPEPIEEEEPVEVTRKNISPGEPSIGKMGSSVKEGILTDVKNGSTGPGTFLNGKYEEHLKLLWKRGEVKFDGEQYYL